MHIEVKELASENYSVCVAHADELCTGWANVNGCLGMLWWNDGCFIVSNLNGITMSFFFKMSNTVIYLKLIPSREVTI